VGGSARATVKKRRENFSIAWTCSELHLAAKLAKINATLRC